jgi:hypothetical protein
VVDWAKAAPDVSNEAAISEMARRFCIVSSSENDDAFQPSEAADVPVPSAPMPLFPCAMFRLGSARISSLCDLVMGQ